MVLSAVGGGCDWISTTLQHLNSPRRAYRLSDRKSTRLNSSHLGISYAVFCLKKKITESEVAIEWSHSKSLAHCARMGRIFSISARSRLRSHSNTKSSTQCSTKITIRHISIT